ncbi:MAG TPA: hypothetical protein VJ904_14610 [Tichowtungia sp.]|nr:hypothetical protein [Tichowtungia sp.]
MTMPLYCSSTNVLILKVRLDGMYPGGLDAFRQDWPNRAEDDDLVKLHPRHGIDLAEIQFRLRRKGMKPGRDYAVTDFKGRPERLSDGIVFDRTMDIAADHYSWRARAGEQESNIVSFPRSGGRHVSLVRGREYAPNLVILDQHDETGHLELSICVNPEGQLVFQRVEDRAESAESDQTMSGWSCRSVRPESVPQVLVELMAERFRCEEDFTGWLKEKGIESELIRAGI